MVFNVCEVALYAGMLFLASSGGRPGPRLRRRSPAFRVATLISSYAFLLGPVLESSLVELLDDAGPALRRLPRPRRRRAAPPALPRRRRPCRCWSPARWPASPSTRWCCA